MYRPFYHKCILAFWKRVGSNKEFFSGHPILELQQPELLTQTKSFFTAKSKTKNSLIHYRRQSLEKVKLIQCITKVPGLLYNRPVHFQTSTFGCLFVDPL